MTQVTESIDGRPEAPAVATGDGTARRIDLGRIVMVPLSVVLGAGSVLQCLSLLLSSGPGAPPEIFALVTGAQTAAFYAIMVWAYVRRGPASATSRAPLALVAAPTATFLPFALPFLGEGGVGGPVLAVGNALLVVGMTWSLWSIRCLDKSLSVVPQARQLVERGPYGWVRHPLYLGELVAMLGLSLALGGPLPVAAWVALVGLQAFRAVKEEELLSVALPGYAAYRERTSRILPGVF